MTASFDRRYEELRQEVFHSKELQAEVAKYSDFVQYVSNQTGVANLDQEPWMAYKIYNNIKSAVSANSAYELNPNK